MSAAEQEFSSRMSAVVRRFLAQNGVAAIEASRLDAMAARLWSVIRERGLPRPLCPDEPGEAGGMDETDCARVVAQVMGDVTQPMLADAVRQITKACFHPEFKTCRNSFREVAADGTCRRQELARVRRRVSGTHCVDCPYWVALDVAAHARFVAAHWRAGAAEFEQHRDLYLPEDFRALRQWLHAAARDPAIFR